MAPQPLHLALALRGGYKTTQTEIDNEIWVNTLKLLVTLDGTPDPVGTLASEFSVAHATLTASGTGWSGNSAWLLDGGIDDFDPLSWLVDYAMPASLSWMALTGRSSNCILQSIALYPMDTTGHAIGAPGFGAPTPATITFDSGSEPAGGSSGNILPLQTSCVASHRTAYAGRKGRGRMFLAGLVDSVHDSQGQFTSTFVNAVLAKQTTFLEDLTRNDTPPVVFPALIPDGTSWAIINEVRVGTVPDTQRRRRAQLAETFVSDTVTP